MEKNNRPLVSVVIPCYNHEQFVQDSIQSVIDQSYDNIELIIIDDGSKDHSVKKIEQLIDQCEQRFKRFEFRTRPNKGLSATLNEALAWCSGTYYSALASDDQMFKHKTLRQIEIFNDRPEIVAVFGAVELIDENNRSLGEMRQKTKLFTFEDLIYKDEFLPAPTQMIHLATLKQIGGYVDGMIIEDWYSYLKLLERGNQILYVDEVFSYYRSHGFNTVANPYKMALGRLQVLNEFKDHEMFEKAFIKSNWDTVIALTRSNFRLSMQVLMSRVVHILKLLFKKITR